MSTALDTAPLAACLALLALACVLGACAAPAPAGGDGPVPGDVAARGADEATALGADETGARAPWSDAAGAVADRELARLCVEAWDLHLESDPIGASYLGDDRFHGRLPDNSPQGEQRRAAVAGALAARARAIDPARLSEADRLTRQFLVEGFEDALAEHDLAFDVAGWSVDPRNGPQAEFLSLAADQPHATAAERAALLERWSAMPGFLDQAGTNLRRGLAQGRVAARKSVADAVAQLDQLLATPVAASPLVLPLAAGPGDELARVTTLVEKEIYPAFRRYRAVLADLVLPRARDDERPGVLHVSGGDAYYRLRIRRETSLVLEPEEIHAIGLAEVARIRAEIAALGERVFGTRDVAAIQARLRTDPALHFTSAEEIEAKARAALARAEAAVPRAFGRLPAAACEVVPIPAHEAPFTTVAYYRQPAADGTRPGRYYVNTYAPTTRTRYEAEVLAYHEAVPGHHTQIAIAQELAGLPLVRRHQGSTAYVEGWALYTERLCDELGLYGSDVDRLGMLSYDAWRACRLVVDTGLHAFGWSRGRAIEYMTDNTLLAENNVANEVDRYIAWPGQALAYKLGQREILALRAEARAALGTRFDLAAFHDRVLENGALTLALLRGSIERWIAGGGRAAR